MKEIAIVHQITGNHGNGATKTYRQLFQAAFPEAKQTYIEARTDWKTLNLDPQLYSLAKQVRQLGRESILVFLGASWHSRVIHKNPALRAILKNSNALKIGIFQESFLAKKDSSVLIREMKANYYNCSGLFNIRIFNHYRDFLVANANEHQKEGESKILYLPFLNPTGDSVAEYLGNSSKRKNRILYVGGCPYYSGNPYIVRSLVLEKATKNDSFDWVDPGQVYNTQHISHEEYIRLLCSYNFALVPPSIDSSLTVRQIEASSAGAIPLTPSPVYDLEMQMFKDGYNCFYYDPLSRLDEFFLQVLSLSSERLEEVRLNAYRTANAHSPINVASKLRQLILSDNSECIALRQLLPVESMLKEQKSCKKGWRIAIDLVFFQFADTGIAKVWESLLEFFAEDPIRDSIILFIRKDSPYVPKVVDCFCNIELPAYMAENKDQDAFLIDWACDQEDVAVFVSTYMTFSHSRHNVVMVHDCIPERVSKRALYEPHWEAKKAAISNADSIFTISNYSCEEILAFYPEARKKKLFLTPNTIRPSFIRALSSIAPSTSREEENLKDSAYCLMVGERMGYLGYKNGGLALKALASYNEKHDYKLDLRVVGGWRSDSHPLSKFDIDPELNCHANKLRITRSVVSDEELISLYRDAVCLLYLSEDEGYGLPIYECLASGGRVIVMDRPFNRGIAHPNLIKVKQSTEEQITQAISIAYLQKKNGSEIPSNHISEIPGVSSFPKQCQSISEILQLIQLAETDDPLKANLYHNILTNKFSTLSEASAYMLGKHPANITFVDNPENPEIKFGYVTSTFKGGKFFEQLVEDIIGSNIDPSAPNQRMAIEHIVIDSDSPEDELVIFKNAQLGSHYSYLYYKTPYRETLYSAWNRGIRLSEAEYISNANTDDRHSPLFAYVTSLYLDAHPEILLAYTDQIISETPNTLYLEEESRRRWAWPRYTYSQILTGNHIGSTPVWRRSVHSSIGYFKQEYKCAGDWEFWLRIATKAGSLGLINLPLSSYLFNASGIEHGNPQQSLLECQEIQDYYATFGEYAISERDTTPADSARTRSIDDMQYSGFVGTRLTLVVFEDLAPSTIIDILSLGQLDATAAISMCPLNNKSPAILPRKSYLSTLDELYEALPNFEDVDVYLHRNAFSSLESSRVANSSLATAFSLSVRIADIQPEELPGFLFYKGFKFIKPSD